ncbi:DUF689-domain-containing protein [Wilcoxina mikolae CBS 423.85]|nr:DUF689-domain-containing protein [Wilcoxina mikolae CBS 423.85]
MAPPPPPPSAVRMPDVSMSDFNPTPATTTTAASPQTRTLILCPPTVSSNPEALQNALATVDRGSTDVQMLDRLALNLVTLPEGIYSTVLLLSDPSSSGTPINLEKPLLEKVLASMVPGSRWRSLGTKDWATDRLRFLTTGFLVEDSPDEGVVVVKPDFGGQKSVALNLRKRQPAGGASVVKPIVATPVAPPPPPVTNNGVGFVDFSDDLDDDDDGELIDEDELMADENLATPVQIPAECRPKPGKRRRACKDCTCGLKEQIEQEDLEKRTAADEALAAAKAKAAAGVKLTADDLAEIDFTVEGKANPDPIFTSQSQPVNPQTMSFTTLQSEPTTSRSTGYSDNPEFTTLTQSLATSLTNLTTNIVQLNRHLSLLGTKRDSESIRDDIHHLLTTTRSGFRELSVGVKRAKDWSSEYDASPGMKFAQQKLQDRFTSTLQDFQGVQRLAAERSRLYVLAAKREMQLDEEEEEEEEREEAAEVPLVQEQAALADQGEVEFRDSLIIQREEEIRGIEQGINEVNDIFKELGTIVEDQEEGLDAIRGDMESFAADHRAAERELASAVRYGPGKRAGCLVLFVALVVVIVVLAVFLG